MTIFHYKGREINIGLLDTSIITTSSPMLYEVLLLWNSMICRYMEWIYRRHCFRRKYFCKNTYMKTIQLCFVHYINRFNRSEQPKRIKMAEHQTLHKIHRSWRVYTRGIDVQVKILKKKTNLIIEGPL